MQSKNKMDLNKKILWCLHEFSQEAYELGGLAKETDKNPFPKNSSNWYSWNRGKNLLQ